MAEYADNYVPVAARFPRVILENFRRDTVPASWDEIKEECRKTAQGFTVEPLVASRIEAETRKQATSRLWFAFRAGRVTASNAKSVCCTSPGKPSHSLVKKLCYPEVMQFWAPQIAWGKENEKNAKDAYISKAVDLHHDFVFEESGLHISSAHPYLAATPDGLVQCTCCGRGVLEVKCPYTSRNCTIAEAAEQQNGCLAIDNRVKLKRSHEYYYQVQMLVCGREYCDFVVWTTRDIFHHRIYRDIEFCTSMLARSERFFREALLPEMCFRYWTRKNAIETSSQAEDVGDEENCSDSTAQRKYCFCGGPESGEMIMCDGTACKPKWFHFECVKLKAAPKGRWLCRVCTRKGRKVK